MFRMGLAWYLIAVTLAGPWYCCCSALQLGALVLPSAQARAAEEGQPACPSCCCTQAADEQPEPALATAPTRGHTCACEAGRPEAVIGVTGKDSSEAGTTRLPALEPSVPAGAPWSPSATSLVQTSKRCIAFPFLDCRDILSALHLLRC